MAHLAVAGQLAGDVAPDRRPRFDLELAVVRLALARRRGAALTYIRMRDTAAARAALAAIPAEHREWLEVRTVDAAIALADGEPERAVDVLGPVIEDEPEDRAGWAMLEALVVDAVARDRLGDRRGAETALEQALDRAESDGIILPFLMTPVGDLLERHPRHRTAHATLLSEILDVRAGNAPVAAGAPSRRTSSAPPSCASRATCPRTSRRPRSRPSCSCPTTRSART